MTPMQIIEGSRSTREGLVEERVFAEGRLLALAEAVRQHEETARGHIAVGARAHDRRLYRRLRDICGARSGR
jgi:hypothetical protein